MADVPMMSLAMALQVDGLVPESQPLAAYLERLRSRPSYRAISPDTPAPASRETD